MTRSVARLTGQVALVTDAAQSVAAGIARRFAAEGAAVVVHSADAQAATRVVAEIVWRGGRAITAQGDLTHWPDVRRLFEDTLSTFGGLDILVNGAGLTAACVQEETRQDDDAEPLDGELFGAMLLCQEAVQTFGAAGGDIINLTSPESCTMAPAMCPDRAPAAAVDTMTRGLSQTFGPRGIRAHAIALDTAGDPGTALHVLDRHDVNPDYITVAAARRRLPNAIAELAVSLTCPASRPGRAVMIAGGS